MLRILKWTVTVGLGLLAVWAANVSAGGSVRLEPDAVLGPTVGGMENRQELFDELVGMIRMRGWRCDSISSARTLFFSRGFEVGCNLYAYQYLLKDEGGNWVVTLK